MASRFDSFSTKKGSILHSAFPITRLTFFVSCVRTVSTVLCIGCCKTSPKHPRCIVPCAKKRFETMSVIRKRVQSVSQRTKQCYYGIDCAGIRNACQLISVAQRRATNQKISHFHRATACCNHDAARSPNILRNPLRACVISA